MSLSAHAFETAGLLFCVSHVWIESGRPLTPPFALICATRIFAAASAGPSNGAIAPFASNAQPMTIGLPAVVRAAAVAARTSPATAIATSALRFTLFSSLDGSCRHPPFHPAFDQLLPAPSDELGAVDVPERVRVGDAERSVVGEDLDVVEAVPACAVERAKDGGHRRDAVSWKDAIGPAARRLAPVVHVDAGDERRMPLDLVEELGCVPEMPDVELDAERRGADLLDDRRGIVERARDRPALEALALERLQRDAQADPLGLGDHLAQASEGGATVAGAGDAEHGGGLEGREPVQRAQDRVDALARVVRAGEERQGKDRRDRRDSGGRAEPALAEERDRLVVGAVAELHLPDA